MDINKMGMRMYYLRALLSLSFTKEYQTHPFHGNFRLCIMQFEAKQQTHHVGTNSTPGSDVYLCEPIITAEKTNRQE